MSKVWQIAVREFVATVFTKAFIIGLMVLPVIIVVMAVVGPRLFGASDFAVRGELAVIDSTGRVLPELRAGLTEGTSTGDLADLIRRTRAEASDDIVAEALALRPNLTLVEHPAGADVEEVKAWLLTGTPETPHLGVAVIHANAVEPGTGESGYGSYDMYVPANQDGRAEIAMAQSLREAIVTARMKRRGLDRALVNELTTVPRVQSTTVSEEGERRTVGGFQFALPIMFMVLLMMGVMGSGQGLLTTVIEEKSSRVIEVLLSAVSPIQLMAGKLLGHMAITLLAMSVYILLGLLTFVVLAIRAARPDADSLFVHFLRDRLLHARIAHDGRGGRGQRYARGAVADDAADACTDLAVVHDDPGLARSRLDVRDRHELRPTAQYVRHAAALGVDSAAADVAGLGVDRDRGRRRHRQHVGRREDLQDRPPDVRQAAELQDARAVGAGRVARLNGYQSCAKKPSGTLSFLRPKTFGRRPLGM
jgi:ABC-type Na+ efflux pump permease subunit